MALLKATRTRPHTASADTRRACATHRYEAGMSLWEVQKLLGHDWTTTTVRYILPTRGDPEMASRRPSARASQRLRVDAGGLSRSGTCGGRRPTGAPGGQAS
ncbi:tyrosine-type recombinase/integrase [Streptomyces halstedii]|uniref:tyrosine-type recombinase/integrase n=1 Tax=Streptomyces halstedii TaxID=1944 RepID=UPI0036AA494B